MPGSGANNPKKAALRVLITYPHPVMRLPIVCSQCKVPVCADACPVGALHRIDGEQFERLLDLYYRKRGWDRDGMPEAGLEGAFSETY